MQTINIKPLSVNQRINDMETWTAEEYKQHLRENEMKKKSKFRNKVFSNKHGRWHSQKEYLRYLELTELQRVGRIRDLEKQVRFLLIDKDEKERATYYIADFTYYEGDRFIVEDVKSEYTRKLPLYKMKRKLMKTRYSIEIRET